MSPFRLFAVAGLIGTLVITGASLIASDRAGEAEAMADVRLLTRTVAKTVVEPALNDSLLAGESDAIDALDQIVRNQVLDESTVRVKLWDASGRIVYSDEPRLIGETYQLDDEKNASLWSGDAVSEISSLGGAENRFETADRLLEVYLPVNGPDGQPLLYESYFATSRISESAIRIRSEFVPITVAALLVMEAMHLGLAWGLNRRTRAAQAERERLLTRAIESSDIERRRIAADLHDGVVQDLVGMAFAVSAAAETADQSAPELAADLRAAASGTRQSLHSLRSLLVDIYPPNLDEHGLEVALEDLLVSAAAVGIGTDFKFSGDIDLDSDVVALAYRVAQEAIRNIVRHSDATAVGVRVDVSAERLSLRIDDDGRGFDPSDAVGEGHLGLRVVADLASDAGAELDIVAAAGEGVSIRLEIYL